MKIDIKDVDGKHIIIENGENCVYIGTAEDEMMSSFDRDGLEDFIDALRFIGKRIK